MVPLVHVRAGTAEVEGITPHPPQGFLGEKGFLIRCFIAQLSCPLHASGATESSEFEVVSVHCYSQWEHVGLHETCIYPDGENHKLQRQM